MTRTTRDVRPSIDNGNFDDHYNKGDGLANPWLDKDVQPLALTDEIYEPFLYDPNPTLSAVRRTVELVGEGIHWNGG